MDTSKCNRAVEYLPAFNGGYVTDRIFENRQSVDKYLTTVFENRRKND